MSALNLKKVDDPLKLGKYTLTKRVIQGGMGVGISWDKLAGSVSFEGAMGVVSATGTGYYENKKYAVLAKTGQPITPENFYSRKALEVIYMRARIISGPDKPLACNILNASCDWKRIAKDACEIGFDFIIMGAGVPAGLAEVLKDFPNVGLIPIVSSARLLGMICRKWKRYGRKPAAVVVEGPLSGGHQGFSYDECFKEEFQLENILPGIIAEAKNWDNVPIFAAGGIWDKKDIDKMLALGCAGVQMGTRFIFTHECDASDNFKQVLINAKKEDIKLLKSPVGLPARGVLTNLQKMIEEGNAPKVVCVSNCVSPCDQGVEAKLVGYCIADRLSAAYEGDVETGLFFTGSNGHKGEKLISIKELLGKLVNGEDYILEAS